MRWFSFAALLVGDLLISPAAMAQEQPANVFNNTVQTAPYLEPFISRPEQDAIAAKKLAALEAKFGRKPNILIVLVDDMGWGDPGVYGGGIAIGAPTPEIDHLARGGLMLTSTYAQPTCTPTRAAILTRRIPTRSGLTRPTLSGENPTINPWDVEVTTAELLSKAGYRTALSGKWHLGEADGSWPHQAGFDEYYGILSVISDMSQQLDPRLYPDLVLRPDRLAALRQVSEAAITKGKKGGPLEVAEEITTTEELGQIDQKFADFSEDFIRRAVADKRPFFLEHSFGRLHNDSYPAKGYAGKSPAGYPYRDGVLEVDDIVKNSSRAKPAPEASKDAPATVPAVPDQYKLNLLIRSTIIAVNQANKTGNYSVLRDLGSPNFQSTNSEAKLTESFSGTSRNASWPPGLAVSSASRRQFFAYSRHS